MVSHGPKKTPGPVRFKHRDARFQVGVALVAVLIPTLWVFGPAIFTAETFAFRDAGHYYYPLFEWTSRQWAAGSVPLWNPHEALGVPVAAEATSSVFYPGKLFFALPTAYHVRYKLYVLGHLLLAAATAYRLARAWRRSRFAAALAGLAYAFSGSVLFQYCNVVFLVGAAWLPLGLLAADRMLRNRSRRWSFVLAMVLAMMVLGGDPQMAYHTGLLAVLYAICLGRFRRTRKMSLLEENNRGRPAALTLLATSAVAAAMLSAIQILPSAQWSRYSRRAEFERPRSLYEVPGFLARYDGQDAWREVGRGLLGKPQPGSHHEHIYHFSVGPWHLAELVWPNCSGRLFSRHLRWTNAIPAEGRTWTPSLYMGLLPLLMAMISWKLRRGSPRVRWLSWSALLSLWSALGWYAVGWLVHEIACGLFGARPEDLPVGHAVGGMYWFMVVLLPGYAYFRYPAKLLVVFALAVSLLAARGFDRHTYRPTKWIPWGLAGTAAASLLGLVLSFVFHSAWNQWLNAVPPDAFFGPLDAAGAMGELRGALVHGLITALCAWGCFQGLQHRHHRLRAALLVLTAVELALAQGWVAPTASLDRFQDQAAYSRWIAGNQAVSPRGGFRIYRGSRNRWLPPAWQNTSSDTRLQDGMSWEVETLYPKYTLHWNISTVEPFGTFVAYDYDLLMRTARRRGPQRPDGVGEPSPEVLRALSVRYLVLPAGVSWPESRPISLPPEAEIPPNSTLWEAEQWQPRAWLAKEVIWLSPLNQPDSDSMLKRTEEVFVPAAQPRRLGQTAVVEAAEPPLIRMDEPSQDMGADRCRITIDKPQRIEIDVQTARPRLLVLNDYFYPGWVAEVETDGQTEKWTAPILRTNRVMRGVLLPAGKHRVVFRYHPRLVSIGAMVSLLAWCIGLAAICKPQGIGSFFRP